MPIDNNDEQDPNAKPSSFGPNAASSPSKTATTRTAKPPPSSLTTSLTNHLETRRRASRLRTLQTQTHIHQIPGLTHYQYQSQPQFQSYFQSQSQSHPQLQPQPWLPTQSKYQETTPSSKPTVDFSSNDFLSLSRNADLRHAFLAETARLTSTHGLSSTGSRLLDGDSNYASDLESMIAAFHDTSAAATAAATATATATAAADTTTTSGLLFNSGYDANVALFTCVPQEGDVLVYDEAIHASVHEGMKGSRVKGKGHKLAFRHNDVRDLERVLLGLVGSGGGGGAGGGTNGSNGEDDSEGVRLGKRNVFVATEAVYSMDGDVANLLEIVALVEKLLPMGNGYIIVDEAHATGVIGPQGRGLVCELQLENKVFARLHTFGKALACGGAIILCSPLVKQYLINYARPLIYTTFMSYPSLAAIKTSYDFFIQGKADPLVQNLNTLVQTLFNRLQDLATRHNLLESEQPLIQCPSECPKSPIFSLLTPYPRSVARYCQVGGFMVRAIVPPTVPKGTERVRVCLHAGNTLEEIDALIERIDQWLSASKAQKIECQPNDNKKFKANL